MRKKKKRKKASDLGKLLRLYHPPPTFYINSHPALLTGHLLTSFSPTPSHDGSSPHPPKQSAAGSCHLPCQHPPPSGTPLPLPLGPTVTPSRCPGGNLLLDQEQPSTNSQLRPGPIPSHTPDNNCRRRPHPLNPLRHCFWHSCFHQPTGHGYHPTLGSPQGKPRAPLGPSRPLLKNCQRIGDIRGHPPITNRPT